MIRIASGIPACPYAAFDRRVNAGSRAAGRRCLFLRTARESNHFNPKGNRAVRVQIVNDCGSCSDALPGVLRGFRPRVPSLGCRKASKSPGSRNHRRPSRLFVHGTGRRGGGRCQVSSKHADANGPCAGFPGTHKSFRTVQVANEAEVASRVETRR